ncbi:MAG: hypothetical protein HY291_10050 [Planctomycetes bacterium]|nr:hypothetical protein [Planctomycetota bacterium]
MPDANAEPKHHPSPANVDTASSKPRGGAGLFSLYRALGNGPVEPAGTAKPAATAEPPPAPAVLSRAARLLAAEAPKPAAASKEEHAKPALREGESVRSAAPVAILPVPLAEAADAKKPAADDSAVLSADDVLNGIEARQAEWPAAQPEFPNRDAEPRRSPEALNQALEEAFTELKPLLDAPLSPRQARRARRGHAARNLHAGAGYENVDKRLIEARQKKQLKRRVRGEDYEQVTVIMDRDLYVALDECLSELSEKAGGHVKLSRSIFVRALLKRFLADAPSKHKALNFAGLFTPDPRSPEELAVIEAALLERLGL